MATDKLKARQSEPRFTRIAAAIGEPTRARMLAYLLGNEYATAGEMARVAGVSAQTASSHLLRMLEQESRAMQLTAAGRQQLGVLLRSFRRR